MSKVIKIAELSAKISEIRVLGAWNKGVKSWALDLLEGIESDNFTSMADLKNAALNGADNWKQFCYGGCALIYNTSIAAQFCTPSEFRATNGGLKAPNSRENWMDVQVRAAYQAWNLISSNI